MGLLDQVIGGLMGGQGGAPSGGMQPGGMQGGGSPMGGVLMSLLGGGGGGGMAGGLGGLLQRFEGAGLGSVAQSWVGNGPNQPVSPQQLQSVFGQDQVQSMASQAGMPPQDFLGQLSQHLPRAVDQMTPGGRLPDEGSVSV